MVYDKGNATYLHGWARFATEGLLLPQDVTMFEGTLEVAGSSSAAASETYNQFYCNQISDNYNKDISRCPNSFCSRILH